MGFNTILGYNLPSYTLDRYVGEGVVVVRFDILIKTTQTGPRGLRLNSNPGEVDTV